MSIGRLYTEGFEWGYGADSPVHSGRNGGWAAVNHSFDAPAPSPTDKVRCLRAYFKATQPVGDPFTGTTLAYSASSDYYDFSIQLLNDGRMRVRTDTSFSHHDVAGLPLDDTWHCFEIGQRFGDNGYFGIRIDGTIIYQDFGFSTPPSDFVRTYHLGYIGGLWDDVALNSGTWCGPGKVVLLPPVSDSSWGLWSPGTSYMEGRAIDGSIEELGPFNSHCGPKNIAYEDHYQNGSIATGTLTESLNNIPPTPVADYNGFDHSHVDDGLGHMVAHPSSQGRVDEGAYRPTVSPSAVEGEECWRIEWDETIAHNYDRRIDRSLLSGTNWIELTMDGSPVTGAVAWEQPQVLCGRAQYILFGDVPDADEYVDVWRVGETEPGDGDPGRFNFGHGGGVSGASSYTKVGPAPIETPSSYSAPQVRIEIPTFGANVLNLAGAGIMVDCEYVPQPELPTYIVGTLTIGPAAPGARRRTGRIVGGSATPVTSSPGSTGSPATPSSLTVGPSAPGTVRE